MRKFKKMLLGMALALSIFAGSVGSCYAAANSITVDITASRAYGKFEYGVAGHQIKITVFYDEVSSSGYKRNDSASDTQFGNVTTAVVSRPNSDGYRYISGYAVGYVDGVEEAVSGVSYA